MIRHQRTVFFAIRTLLVLTLAAPGAAQIPCEDNPYGELPDCSFEQDPFADWTLVSGSFFAPTMSDGDDPHRTGTGSAEVHAVDEGPDVYGLTLASECYEVTPAWQSSFGAWMRLLESVEPVRCYVDRSAYGDSTCSSFRNSSAASAVDPHSGGWAESAGTGELTGGFARLEISCQSIDSFQIQIDDAFSVRPVSCSDHPSNLVQNCSFEDPVVPEGWTVKAGSGHLSTHPALIGNGSVVARPAPGPVAVPEVELSYCTPLSSAVQGVSFGASYRPLGERVDTCAASLTWYETSNCQGTVAGSTEFVVYPTEGGWAGSLSTAKEAAGASAELSLSCAGSDDFTVHIDEVFLLGHTPIFSDGFESGNTSSWASP